MRRLLPVILLLVQPAMAIEAAQPCTSNPAYGFPQEHWATVQPAASGWSVEELQTAKQYAKSIGSQSWLLVENGKIVDSYGPIDHVNSLHSARKSFMSAMYGQAVADGTIDLKKTLNDLGI